MLNMKEFGSLIATQRKKVGLTQDALAAKLGITPQAVSKWENGIGYPDITLVPTISRVLDIPISELFLEDDADRSAHCKFPKEFCSLPFIYAKHNKACYSSKSVESTDEESGTVTFTDGSYADLEEALVCNKGTGEIRILELDPSDSFYGNDFFSSDSSLSQIDEKLKDFHSVSVSNSIHLDVKILTVTDGIPRITAKGSKRLLSHLSYEVSDGTLTVKTTLPANTQYHSDEACEATIYAPFTRGRLLRCSINGSGSDLIKPDFDEAHVSIVGSGDVNAQNCGSLTVKITGNGDTSFKNVERIADIGITGNGDVTIAKAEDAKIKITGNGNVEIEEVKNARINIVGNGDVGARILGGELDVRIVGSGEVTARGNAEKLCCDLLNRGAFLNGKELTVVNAEIKASDRAEICLGAITGESVEKLRSKAVLTVDKRGK